MDSPTEPQKPKRKWLKVLGWIVVIFIGGSILLSSLNNVHQDTTANQSTSDVQQNVVPAQAQTSQENTSQTNTNTAPQENGGAGFVRKTASGVVRASVISFNQVMNINQQMIIFGGGKDAVNDGTGNVCLISGEKNFANVVIGDTVTATGDATTGASGNIVLINCRVDSIQ